MCAMRAALNARRWTVVASNARLRCRLPRPTFCVAVAHPAECTGGQDKIRSAAGLSLEPFWAMYGQHISGWVFEILESYRVANVEPQVDVCLRLIRLFKTK